jgi:hypothetical protein
VMCAAAACAAFTQSLWRYWHGFLIIIKTLITVRDCGADYTGMPVFLQVFSLFCVTFVLTFLHKAC